MNQKVTNIRAVTFRDFWNIFIHRFWVIFLCMLLSIGGLYAFNTVTFKPQYSSTATLYILRQDTDNSAEDTNNDFSLALKVVNDCTYLLKNHTVLDQVIKNLSLNTSYESLYKRISTRNPEDTRILEVSVTANSPKEAKRIVDEICEVGSEKIQDAMGFQQVNFYEHGTVNNEPSNRIRFRTYFIVAVITGILVYLLFVINFMLDDSLKSDEEIESVLGVNILGDIPNANHGNHGKYGYYGKYYHAYYQSDKKRHKRSKRTKE